ncbi:hypothetical protein N7G274_005581 [Stereocaulon virgatum]|uniref:Uncharacterized protein n=1 Tax=Stereocaulon virgatum TaxID=373712 RepID=A0ABR4A7B3_9LECA
MIMASCGQLDVLPLELRLQIYSYILGADHDPLFTWRFEKLPEPRKGDLPVLSVGLFRDENCHAHRRRQAEVDKERTRSVQWHDPVEEAFLIALRWAGHYRRRRQRIANIIYELTGELRTPNKVSSHLSALQLVKPALEPSITHVYLPRPGSPTRLALQR